MKLFTSTLSLFTLFAVNLLAQHAKVDPLTMRQLDAIKEKNAGIQTIEPKLAEFKSTLFCIGRIQAIPTNRTVVSSRIAGRVVSRPPAVGDIVEAGQTIIKVESRQPGSPPPVIPVVAAAGGMVFESHVNLGEPVDPSEELMDIIDIRQVWAVANIPESKAAQVKVGQEAEIKVISLGNEVFKGKLIKFGTEADSNSGTLKAIFLLDNPDLKLRPNMLTEFQITTKKREKVFSIPKSAIQGDKINAHVFKRDYTVPHLFIKVPIVVGEENHESAEVILQDKELNVADEVVISGGYFLTHYSSTSSSLKDALDAAHGHEHNEDGSEMSAADKAKAAAAKAGGGGVASGGGGASSELVIILSVACVILTGLLIFTIFKKSDVN